MLRAFLDGSHRQHSPATLSVAGFVGPAATWSAFQKVWREARASADIPFLHMADLMSGKAAPYRDWTSKKKLAVTQHLVRRINSTAWFGVAAALDMAQFHAVRSETTVDNPYLFCAASCIGQIAARLDRLDVPEQVLYVFESGDRGEPAFRDAARKIGAASERYRQVMHIFSILPGTKARFPALDSADFLAWHVSRAVGAKASGIRYRDPVFSGLRIPIEDVYIHSPEDVAKIVNRDSERIEKIKKEFGLRYGGKQRKRAQGRP